MSELKIHGSSRPSIGPAHDIDVVPGGHKPQAPQLAGVAASTRGTPLAGLPATTASAMPPGTPDVFRRLLEAGLESNHHIAGELQKHLHPGLRQQFEDASARHRVATESGGHPGFGYPARSSP
jgi:hypothetical protein